MNDFFNKPHSIELTDRPLPVPYAYRLSYRISLGCLILNYCVGRKGCSHTKFQVITNAILFPETRNRFIDFLESTTPTMTELRFDPHTNFVLQFMLSEGLIQFQKTDALFRLTKFGKEFALNIASNSSNVMIDETNFLKKYSTKLKEDLDFKILSIEGTIFEVK